MRYRLLLSFRGTDYSGWQIQDNANTIQGALQKSLNLVLQEKISVVGCGRTDSGVHAKNYVCHFDYSGIILENSLYRLNKILSDDIVIHSIKNVSNDFHARFDASKRTYNYIITLEKDPFNYKLTYKFPYTKKIDLELLNDIGEIIKTGKDFTNFSKVGSDNKSHLCSVSVCNWQAIDNKYVLVISANRFLRGMVRLIVGASLNVILEKLTIQDIQQAISLKKALPINWSVPASGLFLTKIEY